MIQSWTPGTTYTYGDIVEYEGINYKIIQPHTSQSDWTPSLTPGLWGRVPNEKPHVQQPQSVNPPQEKQKHWYDLNNKQKKPLETGGGFAAGFGLLAAGFGAYHHHEKEENQKPNAYSRERWIEEAQKRTADFNQRGPQGPTTWVLVQGKEIPPSAIVVANLRGEPVYIARAFHEGGIQLGHASHSLRKGAQLGYAHTVVELDLYEVLIGDSRAITWVDAQGRFKPEDFGARPVEGGQEGNGTPLYIALVNYDGVYIPGKARRDMDGALIAYGGTEKRGRKYKVLVYA